MACPSRLCFSASRRKAISCAFRSWTLLPVPLFLSAICAFADPSPNRREIWVPTDQIDSVLKLNPRAVLLSKEQYEVLLRDALATKPDALRPPVETIVQSANFTAAPIGEALQITGTLEIEVLSDDWETLPLEIDSENLTQLTLDGQTAADSKTRSDDLSLLVRGKGKHTIGLEFAVPSPAGAALMRLPTTASGKLKLVLPRGFTADVCGSKILKFATTHFPAHTEATLAFSGESKSVNLTWRAGDPSRGIIGLIVQSSQTVYRILPDHISVDTTIEARSQMGRLPESLKIKVPEKSVVSNVTGPSVTSWNVEHDAVLVSSAGQNTTIRITFDTPFSGTLPLPFIENARRITGRFAVLGSENIKIRAVNAGSLKAAPQWFPREIQSDSRFAGAWSFDNFPQQVSVEISPGDSAFDANIDTAITFSLDGIYINRTVAIHDSEQCLTEARFDIPKGEDLLDITGEDSATEANWRQEKQTVTVKLSPSSKFILKTRAEPEGWSTIPADGIEFSPAPLALARVRHVSGYTAATADPSFRIETILQDGLEPRDGRVTPVRGDYAWFGRGVSRPELRVTRRTPEVSAHVMGYILPTANTLEINASIRYDIRFSGVRTARIKIPQADLFHVDGPGIAERKCDGDIWTITFQKELLGAAALRVSGQIPLEKGVPATVPMIEPLEAPRFAGTWAVEANPGTEIHFEEAGMNELDTLNAPQIDGYTPRHRVIAVFGFLGNAGTVKLKTERHVPAETPAIVVDRVDLRSVASTSGATRHQAMFSLRNAGEQFLEIALPKKAKLWSLMLDGNPVKPVQGAPGAVRVELQVSNQSPGPPSRIDVVYETPGREWRGSGGFDLAAPKVNPTIPILASEWKVWLPDGYAFNRLASNLQLADKPPEEPLLWEKGADVIAGLVEPRVGFVVPQPTPSDNEAAEVISPEASLFAVAAPPVAEVSRKLQIVIPKIELKDAAIQDVIDFLIERSRQHDPEGNGVNIVLRLDFGMTPPPITLSLTNVPLLEALKYVTTLANLRYRIDANGVSIVPLSEPTDLLITKQFRVPSIFKNDRNANLPAKELLENEGVSFPLGASAAFNSTRTLLIVKNTQENLDLVETLTFVIEEPPEVFLPSSTAGKLPLELELQPQGQPVVFSGAYAADWARIGYLDWWSRGRRMWIWLVLGGLVFLLAGSQKPWRRVLWGLLIFTFIPLCISRTWTLECNGLLAGWMAAFFVTLLHRVCRPRWPVAERTERSEA